MVGVGGFSRLYTTRLEGEAYRKRRAGEILAPLDAIAENLMAEWHAARGNADQATGRCYIS